MVRASVRLKLGTSMRRPCRLARMMPLGRMFTRLQHKMSDLVRDDVGERVREGIRPVGHLRNPVAENIRASAGQVRLAEHTGLSAFLLLLIPRQQQHVDMELAVLKRADGHSAIVPDRAHANDRVNRCDTSLGCVDDLG